MPILRIALAVVAAIVAFAAVIRQPVLRNLPYESRDRADAAALRRHVIALTQWPHSADHLDGLNENARYIERHFRAAAARVEVQEFDARKRRYRNVIAKFGPDDGATLIIGAHYD
ncbi:MAG TPA: hypothetical protein VE010_00600, partial [Thermoanaerobaculia bacterium]|nr:hypothetical protein [Thermoanaerobaculia bacterium]